MINEANQQRSSLQSDRIQRESRKVVRNFDLMIWSITRPLENQLSGDIIHFYNVVSIRNRTTILNDRSSAHAMYIPSNILLIDIGPKAGMRARWATSQLCSPGYAVNKPSCTALRICIRPPEMTFSNLFSSMSSLSNALEQMKTRSCPPKVSLNISPRSRQRNRSFWGIEKELVHHILLPCWRDWSLGTRRQRRAHFPRWAAPWELGSVLPSGGQECCTM